MKCSQCKINKGSKEFYLNAHTLNCKECIRKRVALRWRKLMRNSKWRAKERKRNRDWKNANRDKVREVNKNWYGRVRFEVLQAYSRKIPRCACCGNSNLEFLAVDHINGNGGKHRRELKAAGRGSNFFLWLKRNNFPKGYQILCHNCNFSTGRYGYCPHKKTKTL